MTEIKSLKDIESFEAIPAENRWRGTCAYDMIQKSAETFAHRPALSYQATSDIDEVPQVTLYSELLTKINQTANCLHASAVPVGGVTSVILPNIPQAAFGLWGAEALGIVGPINPLLESVALRDIMQESEAEALIVLGPMQGNKAGSEIWEKTLAIVDEVTSLKLILQVNLNPPELTEFKSPGGIPVHDFDTYIRQFNGDNLDFDREILSDGVSAYFHTGGTTGRPKLAQHSHLNHVHLTSMMIDMLNYDEHSVALGGLPLFHVNSFFNAGLNMFACGGHAVLLTAAGFRDKGVVQNLWHLVEKYKATYFAAVPTVVSALLEHDIGDADLSSLDFIICGAAPIAPEIFRKFQEETNANVIEAYGMTEGTLFSSGNPQFGEKRIGSIGIRVPYQPMKCAVLDENNNYIRDCKTDEIGTILFKGPNVFKGYKQVEKNKDVFHEEWVISGDLAREDEDGYFWMVGRSKDLIIRGGHNIDPKSIEDALSEHPDVSLIAAVAQPDSYAGELPCVYLTLNDQLDTIPEVEALMDYARAHIPERAAIPVHIEIIDTMPVTAVGKIFKPALVAKSTQRVLSNALIENNCPANVQIEQDDKRGLVAMISDFNTSQIAEVNEVLGSFAISYELIE